MSFVPSEYDNGYNQGCIDSRPEVTTRPWGYWYVLEEGLGYKVKKLVIQPKQSISKQYHLHRSETWCIISGSGQAFLDAKIKPLNPGDVFTVKKNQLHKVTNNSETVELVAIEVQMGDRCEEADIVRIE